MKKILLILMSGFVSMYHCPSEAMDLDRVDTLSKPKTERRGRNRLEYKGESNLLERGRADAGEVRIAATPTSNWGQAANPGFRYSIGGRLISAVKDTVDLVKGTMDYRTAVYEPEFLERKQVYSAWFDTKDLLETKNWGTLLTDYVGQHNDPNLRSLKINPNVSFNISTYVVCGRDFNNNLVFLSIHDLKIVYEEIVGTWATRHGDFYAPDSFANMLKSQLDLSEVDKAFITLGLNNSATWDNVNSTYKKLALKNHPDKGGEEEKFKAIANAHDILYRFFEKK